MLMTRTLALLKQLVQPQKKRGILSRQLKTCQNRPENELKETIFCLSKFHIYKYKNQVPTFLLRPTFH